MREVLTDKNCSATTSVRVVRVSIISSCVVHGTDLMLVLIVIQRAPEAAHRRTSWILVSCEPHQRSLVSIHVAMQQLGRLKTLLSQPFQ